MFMTLLVPGPNDPGKNLNVYLRPLIDELIDLWQVSVHTFDATYFSTKNVDYFFFTFNYKKLFKYMAGWCTYI